MNSSNLTNDEPLNKKIKLNNDSPIHKLPETLSFSNETIKSLEQSNAPLKPNQPLEEQLKPPKT